MIVHDGTQAQMSVAQFIAELRLSRAVGGAGGRSAAGAWHGARERHPRPSPLGATALRTALALTTPLSVMLTELAECRITTPPPLPPDGLPA